MEGMHGERDGASMLSLDTSLSLEVFTVLAALQILLFKSVYRVDLEIFVLKPSTRALCFLRHF